MTAQRNAPPSASNNRNFIVMLGIILVLGLAILGYVEQLAGLDLSGVEPAPYPFDMPLPLRPDTPRPTLAPEEATGNAPAREGSAFAVPKIVGA